MDQEDGLAETGSVDRATTRPDRTRRTNIKPSRRTVDSRDAESGYQTDNSIEDLLAQWSIQDKAEGSDSDASSGNGAERPEWQDSIVADESNTDSNLAFLVSSFPDTDPTVLAELLAQYGDIDRATDAILSSDLLANEAINDSRQASASGETTFLPPPLSKKIKKAQRRKEKKSQLRDSDTVHVNLTDLRHKDLNQRQGKAQPSHDHRYDSNRWVSTSSTLAYLAQLLQRDESSLQSIYHSSGGDMAIAVDAAVADVILSRKEVPQDLGLKMDLLKGLFPFTSPQLLKSALLATFDGQSGTRDDAQVHLDHSVDLVYILEEIKSHYGEAKSSEILKSGEGRTAGEAALRSSVAASTRSHSLDQQKLNALIARRDAGLPSALRNKTPNSSLSDDHTSLSAQECLSLSLEYRQRRDEAFAKASSAWTAAKSTSGMRGQGGRGVAYYYANLGKELDQLSRDWDLKAARVGVLDRRQQNGGYALAGASGRESAHTIDLHGCTVHQGLSITKEAINDWHVHIATAAHQPGLPLPRLTIVTGQGKHSPQGQSVLYPSIVKMLREEGWSYIERKHEGVIQVVKRGRV